MKAVLTLCALFAAHASFAVGVEVAPCAGLLRSLLPGETNASPLFIAAQREKDTNWAPIAVLADLLLSQGNRYGELLSARLAALQEKNPSALRVQARAQRILQDLDQRWLNREVLDPPLLDSAKVLLDKYGLPEGIELPLDLGREAFAPQLEALIPTFERWNLTSLKVEFRRTLETQTLFAFEETLNQIVALSRRVPLRKLELNLSGFAGRPENPAQSLRAFFQALATDPKAAQQLEELGLSGTTDRHSLPADTLESFRPFVNLSSLKLVTWEYPQAEALAVLQALPKLTHLELDGFRIARREIDVQISQLRHLRSLIYASPLIERHSPLTDLKGLKELHLSRARVFPGSLERWLKNNRQLEVLTLESLEVQGVSPEENIRAHQSILNSVGGLKQLQVFSWAGTHARDFRPLIKLSQLRSLDLCMAWLRPGQLSDLSQIPNLKRLALINAILPEPAPFFELLRLFPALQVLQLYLGDKWADQEIGFMKSLPHLAVIEGQIGSPISDPWGDRFRAAFPDLEVVLFRSAYELYQFPR